MENLIAPWAEVASVSMFEDGIISWYSSGNSFPMQKAINKLNKYLPDLKFFKADNIDDAEIILNKVKTLGDPNWLGVAQWSEETDYKWQLDVLKGREYRSTVVHELGHALGLGHPKDHYLNTKTIMSYARDRRKWRFKKQDRVSIEEIFFPDRRDVITRPFDMFDKHTLPSIRAVTPRVFHTEDEDHKHIFEFDYLTGIKITSRI